MSGRFHCTGSCAQRLLAGFLLTGLAVLARPVHGATRLVPEEYLTIQAAIDASATGDTVMIGPGTYRGNGNRDIELRGRDLVVKSRTGPEETIIDCEQAGRGFYLHEWETRAARIEGLSIQRGRVPDAGGGIYASLSSPTIAGCHVLECTAFRGGGLALIVFDGVVENCAISGNTGEQHGGGIWFELGDPEIRDCVITGNAAEYYGGGVCFGGPGTNRLFGCTVAANVSHFGGGMYAPNPLLLERCIVWDNCAVSYGPEILCGDADVRCSDIDTTGVFGADVSFDADCVFTDPLFCSPVPCGLTTGGDWSLEAASTCLPEHSPCGELIGALDQGCGGPTPTGACCFSDGSCRLLEETQCESEEGGYMGDETLCEPNPCHPTPIETTSWGRLKARFRHGGR